MWSFLISDSDSGKNLSGSLIIDRIGHSIIYPFVNGKVDVALTGFGTYMTKIKYEVWVEGYIVKQGFIIGVYPQTINLKMSKIGVSEGSEG